MNLAELRKSAIMIEAAECRFGHGYWKQQVVKRAPMCLCGGPKQPGKYTCLPCMKGMPEHITLTADREPHIQRRCAMLQLDHADRRSKLCATR